MGCNQTGHAFEPEILVLLLINYISLDKLLLSVMALAGGNKGHSEIGQFERFNKDTIYKNGRTVLPVVA